MDNWVSRVRRAIDDRRAVSAAEYAILAVAVVIVVGAAALSLSQPNNNAFAILSSVIGDSVSSAQTNLR